MDKIRIKDIKPLENYETERKEIRKNIIDLKKHRRIFLGDRISIIFENRRTVLFQIQEMIRAEHIIGPEKIQAEIDAYNPLIPEDKELSATLFIEITGAEDIRKTLDGLLGIDDGKRLFFDIGGERLFARFAPGQSREDRISAVHFVRFPFGEEDLVRFRDPEIPVSLIVDHPNYRATTLLTKDTREELGKDLSGPERLKQGGIR